MVFRPSIFWLIAMAATLIRKQHFKHESKDKYIFLISNLLLLLYFNYTFSFRREEDALVLRPLSPHKETCLEWHSALKHAGGSLHYYLIGAQKAGTSKLSNIIRKHHHAKTGKSPKEFHFLDAEIKRSRGSSALMRARLDIEVEELLQAEHNNSGFTMAEFSPYEYQNRSHELLHGDATPMYLMSEEVARLAHLLHPHSKILISLRNPAARAISQMRMAARRVGMNEHPKLSQYFDVTLQAEMDAAVQCGWDLKYGKLDPLRHQKTSDAFGYFADCTRRITNQLLDRNTDGSLKQLRNTIKNDWFILRGLYYDQIVSWLNYFPSTRIMIISFTDVICNMPNLLEKLEQFLCLPKFEISIYEQARRELSCIEPLSKAEKKGEEANPSQNVLYKLESFYRAPNKRLKKLVDHYFRIDSKFEWM